MSPEYSMTINGGAASRCEDLGWSLESITRRNLAPDVCSLRRRHTGARVLEKDDVVVIFADGIRIFTGTAQQPQISETDSAATVTAQILGPWHALNQTTFVRGAPRTQGSGATATASVSGGQLTGITVTNGGSGYLNAHVLFSGGGGTGCAARVHVSDAGVVTSIELLAAGTGFSSAPTVTVVGWTQIPPKLGDTFVVSPGSGIEIWDPTTETWLTPASPTTYKWARADNFAASPKEVDLARYAGTRGLLCDPNWISALIYRTLQQEVTEVLRNTLLDRARLAAVDRPDLTPPFTVDTAAIEASLGATVSPKYRTWSDQKVGSVLASLLAVKPDVSCYFDYHEETPVMHMRVASLETETTLVKGTAPLISLAATPRPDLKPDGIVIRWEYQAAYDWDWRGHRQAAHVDKSPASCLPNEPGVITHTLDFVDDIAQFKPSLASSLMDSIGVLRATGSMQLGGMGLLESLAVRPGMCFRVPSDEMLADCQLLVQECTWNAITHQVSCSLGITRTLDLQTISDLRGWITICCQGYLGARTDLIPPPGP